MEARSERVMRSLPFGSLQCVLAHIEIDGVESQHDGRANRLHRAIAEDEGNQRDQRYRYDHRILCLLLRYIVKVSIDRAVGETDNADRQKHRDIFAAMRAMVVFQIERAFPWHFGADKPGIDIDQNSGVEAEGD